VRGSAGTGYTVIRRNARRDPEMADSRPYAATGTADRTAVARFSAGAGEPRTGPRTSRCNPTEPRENQMRSERQEKQGDATAVAVGNAGSRRRVTRRPAGVPVATTGSRSRCPSCRSALWSRTVWASRSACHRRGRKPGVPRRPRPRVRDCRPTGGTRAAATPIPQSDDTRPPDWTTSTRRCSHGITTDRQPGRYHDSSTVGWTTTAL
jgi:hypothetical protein